MTRTAPTRNLFERIIHGAGYLPECGDHPGNAFAAGLPIFGGLAGVESGGALGFAFGFAFVAVFIWPCWIIGCVSRSRLQDDHDAKRRDGATS